MPNNNKTAKRLTASVAVILLLSVCLAVTTFALVYSMVAVENNFFQTGHVKINLNDQQPVIREDEYLFEPGMTVKKDFFVANEGSCDIYYRLYFQNVSGGLADVLQVSIYDGDKLLYQGTPNQLSQSAVTAADDVLRLGESRTLQMQFYFPPQVGNAAQGMYLNFDFAADAVQVRNNVDKSFQ